MKFWLPATLIVLFAATAQAEDYRAVYSPSLALEVYIDNVDSNAPEDWCHENIHLRIVSGKASESSVLNTFLPRVGNLLQNQCSKLLELPWQMTTETGAVLATGTAAKEQKWHPIVLADGTPAATAGNAEPLDLSQPANAEPLQHFDLPGGCHFRTWWDKNGQSLFIPDGKGLRCTAQGWLEGKSELILTHDGKNERVNVEFYEGFPLQNIHPAAGSLDITAANNQRLVVSRKGAPDSWLLLPFDTAHHVWSFDGTLLVKMDRRQATDAGAVRTRVETMRKAWAAIIDPKTKVTVLLVDDLHADLADPAIGAWRTVN